MAALCLLEAVTMGAGKIATMAVKGGRLAKTAKLISTGANAISGAANLYRSTDVAMGQAAEMYVKYKVNGESFGKETWGEIATLTLGVIGGALSMKGLTKSTKQLGEMAQESGITGRISDSVKAFAKDNGRSSKPGALGKTFGIKDKSGNNTIDNRVVSNFFFNNGERIATTSQIRNYKKLMNSKGINVVVDNKGKKLTGNKAAGFDYSTGTIYIKKKPGVIDLYHEGYHAEQYLNIGQENYVNLGVLAREEYVYSRIMENSSLFNAVELQGATNYIMRVRNRY